MSKKLAVDQFAGLAAVVIAEMPRDLDAEVAQAWMEGAGRIALRGVLDSALREGPPPPVDPDAWVDTLDLTKVELRYFDLTIDPTQTIEQGVVAGAYDYTHPAHTTAVFGSCRKITGDTPIKQRVAAFRIGRNATRQQAKRLRARLNLGAICIQHELALGAQYQQAQRDLNWIVNADDEVSVGGYSVVSYLGGYDAFRYLDCVGARSGWGGSTWVL